VRGLIAPPSGLALPAGSPCATGNGTGYRGPSWFCDSHGLLITRRR
jgi:hypothetical protein